MFGVERPESRSSPEAFAELCALCSSSAFAADALAVFQNAFARLNIAVPISEA